jgi:hypothetical protein
MATGGLAFLELFPIDAIIIMETEITIRPAVPTDAIAVESIARRTWNSTYSGIILRKYQGLASSAASGRRLVAAKINAASQPEYGKHRSPAGPTAAHANVRLHRQNNDS